MITRHVKTLFTLAIFLTGAVVVLSSANVNAAWGPGDGSGGSSGCMNPGWWLSTCYGAAWRKYSVNDAPPGVNNSDKNNITIAGDPVSQGTTIRGCASAGNYYRYAMVAHGYHNYGGWSVNVGDQVGVSAINGNGSYWYKAEPLYGGMNYIPTWSSWDDAHAAYNKAVKSGQVKSGLWNSNSNLGWFCYSDSKTAVFQSNSKLTVKTSGGNKSASSGWNKTTKLVHYEIDQPASSSTVDIEAVNSIRRRDSNGQNIATKYKLWNYNTKSFGDEKTTSALPNKNQKVSSTTTSSSSLGKSFTVKPGKMKKICARIAISKTAKFTPGTNSVSERATIKTSSKVCIRVINMHEPDPPEVDTNDAYVGETKSGTVSRKNDSKFAAYYFVRNDVGTPSASQMGVGDNKVVYIADTTDTSDKDTIDTSQIHSKLCSRKIAGSRISGSSCPSFGKDEDGAKKPSVTIPDTDTYLGAKICAASAGEVYARYTHRVRIPPYTTTQTYTKADGTTGTREVAVYHYEYHYEIAQQFSNISCSPILGKPSFGVAGGNIYAAEGITGIIATKGGTNYTSWAEYLAVVGRPGRDAADEDEDKIAENFGTGANYRKGSSTTDINTTSPLTVANVNTKKGNSDVSSEATAFIDNLRGRYEGLGNTSTVNVIPPNSGGDYIITSNISRPPDGKQNIIFANNIYIAGNVTEVNAWLIADDTINTCYGVDSRSNLDANTCNQSLTINGLAYAQNFKLFRTTVGHGAGGLNAAGRSIGSATPAEFFNMNANVYRWGYQQAQNQKVSVSEIYRQELAPRV